MKNIFIFVLCLCVLPAGFAAAGIPVQNTDPEILGIFSAIDQNDIQAAQLAEQKNINQRVMDYARMLDVDHNEHLDKTRKLSQELGLVVTDNAFVDKLRADGQQDLAALTGLDGPDFARLYIEDMIKGHSEALTWINRQDSQNQAVKKFLQQTQERMDTHLEKAQQIQEQQIKSQIGPVRR